MRHRNDPKATGSAIILVAAVLAALVLIGSAFLMTAVSQKKVTRAQREAVPMDSAIHGVMGLIGERLWEDRFINGNLGPYTSAGVADWRAFIDYASPDPAYGNDLYLASTERARASGDHGVIAGRWPKLTQLLNLPAGATIFNQDPTWQYVNNNPALVLDADGDGTLDAPLRLVDTDGDRVNDAILFPTGTYDESGKQFFAAVRIIDLSGLVNINVANSFAVPNSLVPEMNTSLIDGAALPSTLLGTSAFPTNAIVTKRASDPNGSKFFTQVVRRLENPDPVAAPNFRAFDWSDELACRWMGQPTMNSGRLYSVMTSFRGYANSLTTHSAVRDMPRRTIATQTNWPVPTEKVDLNMRLANQADRWAAFDAYRRAFYYMLPHLDETNPVTLAQRKTMAAQLAVNLIDFRDADDDPTCVEVPDLLGTYVFGVERQPVVTQVWHKLMQFDTTNNVTKHLFAMVLYNPYDAPLNTNASSWFYQVYQATPTPAGATQFAPPVATMQAHDRWAICASDTVLTSAVPCTAISVDSVVPRTDLTSIHIAWSDNLIIYREAMVLWDPAGAAPGTLTQRMPVAVGRGLAILPDNSAGGVTKITCQYDLRDDSPTQYRLFAAKYFRRKAETTVVGATPAYNCENDGLRNDYIGLPNNVTAADLPANDSVMNSDGPFTNLPPMPIYVRGNSGVATANPYRMLSLGELERLLTVGPALPGTPVDVALANQMVPTLAGGPGTNAFMRNLGAGRLDSWGFKDPALYTNARYPVVPPLCLAGDFFAVDGPDGDNIDNDGEGHVDKSIQSFNLVNADWTNGARTLMKTGEFANYQWQMNDEILVTTQDANCKAGWYTIVAKLNADTIQLAQPISNINLNYVSTAKILAHENTVYGRINVNTATLATLCSLPGLARTPSVGTDEADRLQAAGQLLAYRDRLQSVRGSQDFSGGRGLILGASFTGALPYTPREQCGFATAGEVAIPLRVALLGAAGQVHNTYDVTNRGAPAGGCGYRVSAAAGGAPGDDGFAVVDRTAAPPLVANPPQNDVAKWDMRYAYLSNMLTVNSDVFCAYIRIQVGGDSYPKSKRNYIAVFDRSNCVTANDRPIVRMFTEIK